MEIGQEPLSPGAPSQLLKSLEVFRPKQKGADRKSRASLKRINDQLEPAALVAALLPWFTQHARDLPWRRTRDPYGVWISEVMLQQTQVKTVLPYWERWMKQLPTIQALADADLALLHKLWEGLGYYTRVRNLHRAAQRIVREFEGRFPSRFDDVLDLPGIGRYTGGAICSIAFNQPQPVLDGNVIRVLTRLYGIEANVAEVPVRKALWDLATVLVGEAQFAAGHGCSDLNQALMELGALICTPATPDCHACPVRPRCVAYAKGLVRQIPRLPPRAMATARSFVTLVVEQDGNYLVRRRPEGVVNALLWEFPNVEQAVTPPSRKSQAPQRQSGLAAALALAQELGLEVRDCARVCVIKHTITRYRMTLEAYAARAESSARGTVAGGIWCSVAELTALPFTSAHGKVRAALLARELTSAR